jgi:hypothetical protein
VNNTHLAEEQWHHLHQINTWLKHVGDSLECPILPQTKHGSLDPGRDVHTLGFYSNGLNRTRTVKTMHAQQAGVRYHQCHIIGQASHRLAVLPVR